MASIFTISAAGVFAWKTILRKEKLSNPAKHTHTILHVMAEVALTENEILRAAFGSQHIERLVHQNEDTGLADDILLRFRD